MRSLPLLLLLAACGPDLDLTTDGTTMSAVARAGGTTEVSVCPGPHGIFDCAGGSFHASLGGVDQPTSQVFLGGTAATFHTAAGTVVVTRDGDGARATVDLPPAFAGMFVERTDNGVTLRWTPAEDAVKLSVSQTCGNTYSVHDRGTLADQGRANVPKSEMPAGCAVSATLRRERSGKLSGFPDGSSMTGAAEVDVPLQ